MVLSAEVILWLGRFICIPELRTCLEILPKRIQELIFHQRTCSRRIWCAVAKTRSARNFE